MTPWRTREREEREGVGNRLTEDKGDMGEQTKEWEKYEVGGVCGEGGVCGVGGA